ncbi:MAG TPA: acyl carrier protein [Clostridiales bacterium]|jgi:acyl carrier protein|nr:acyl carrier protein [Clostridiales bacterium]
MIFEKVQKIICDQFDLDPEEVTLESDIVKDFNADSLDIIDLAMSIEDEFEIEVPEDKVDGIKTVEDIVKLIEQY